MQLVLLDRIEFEIGVQASTKSIFRNASPMSLEEDVLTNQSNQMTVEKHDARKSSTLFHPHGVSHVNLPLTVYQNFGQT
jgi:hypothetical protein